jgi:hypothetical protein
MKALFTMLQKFALAGLMACFMLAGSLSAQDIEPPEDPDELQDLPLVFNMDTDEVDWEGYTFHDFDGSGLVRLENPDPSGINDTEMVLRYVKGDGQPWAGFFYRTDGPMFRTDNAVFRMKVWSPRAGINALLKLEMQEFDVDTGDMFQPIETANEWVELEWDLSEIADETPFDQVVVIMDIEGGAGDGGDQFTWYLDDFAYLDDAATSTEPVSSDVPQSMELQQNYPNPFNPTTSIEYAVPQSGQVTLEVFNMMGQKVATLVNQTLAAGQHVATFDASNLSSGTYMYRLQAGNQVQTRKMTLIK